MILQHSSMGSPYFGTLAIILLNAKVGTFLPSHTTLYCIDSYFIFKLTFKKNTSVNNVGYMQSLHVFTKNKTSF